MNKLFAVLATLCLVCAAAGNATAAFTYGTNSSLALSFWNDSNNQEYGYDLGVIGVDFDLTDRNVTLGNIGPVDVDATAALYSTTSNTVIDGREKHYESFFGLEIETAPGVTTGTSSYNSMVRDIFSTGYGNTSPANVLATGPKTAATLLKDVGNYGGLVSGGNPALQLDFASLATEDSMDIYLYNYMGRELVAGASADYAAVISIFDNGDVVLNASEVPVPAAVWLMGSGLLALIGVRRKKA